MAATPSFATPTGATAVQVVWRRPRVRMGLLVGGVLLAGIVGLVWLRHGSEQPKYVTALVSRGSVTRAVVATGTVNPVVTVQVGSYVSGTIQKLYCDFNTEVKPGQLCAKIDPRPYQVLVDQETANLASARAQLQKDQAALAYAKLNYERDRGLLAQGVTSQDNVDSDKSTFDQLTAQVALDTASIAQHGAALEAARVNLQYTNIVSPVVGTVISRNIDVGQTVAASFQTPTLFLVAKDLTKMQVDASVSESDIGAIKVGQRASFTVEAFPNRPFWGQVVQLRRAPITIQNVVTYDVVIGVSNPDLLLLPGMTANAMIVSGERDSVIRIPLQALRYTPTGASHDSTRGPGAHGTGRVWVLRGPTPEAVRISIGIDDGTYAELVNGPIKVGDELIVNETPGASRVAGGQTGLRPTGRF